MYDALIFWIITHPIEEIYLWLNYHPLVDRSIRLLRHFLTSNIHGEDKPAILVSRQASCFIFFNNYCFCEPTTKVKIYKHLLTVTFNLPTSRYITILASWAQITISQNQVQYELRITLCKSEKKSAGHCSPRQSPGILCEHLLWCYKTRPYCANV